MNIVRPFTQEIEHLRKGQSHQKVIGGCGVGNREKHRCFPIPDTVKLQFIVGHDLPELGDVKGGKPGTAGNQNTFGCLAAGKFILLILLDCETIRLAFFQPLKHIVHRIHKIFVVLFHLHAGNHIHQCIHIPILGGALENDIGNQGTIQKRFRLLPEWIAFFALSLCVAD